MLDAVSALLNRLLEGTTATLGDQFVGFYLHGSLALGDFDPARSDVDFLVVTDGPLPAERVKGLEAMHARIAASDLAWRTNYEGSYIPRQALRRFDREDSVHPVIRADGSFGHDRHGAEWVIQRHIIRERGVTLAGPAPRTLIDPISADVLREATLAMLEGWWAPQLKDPFRLRGSEYQAYAVLTMCRALYTLHSGAIATKPQAASWAMEHLNSEWHDLIQTAMVWRHSMEMDQFRATHEFVRYALGLSRREGRPRSD